MEEEKPDWINLEDGEQIIKQEEPVNLSMVPALIVGVPLSVIGIGIVIIVAKYLEIKNTNYVITTNSLYRKKGVLSRRIKEIDFEKIQNTELRQGILGNAFNYGSVDVSTAGSGETELTVKDIAFPEEFVKTLSHQLREKEKSLEEKQKDKQKLLDECSTCGHPIEGEEWTNCPECGSTLRKTCENCQRVIELEWNYCPYCSQKQST